MSRPTRVIGASPGFRPWRPPVWAQSPFPCLWRPPPRAVSSFWRSDQTRLVCFPTTPRVSRTAALAVNSAPIHRSTKDMSEGPATCPCARPLAGHATLACLRKPEFWLQRPPSRLPLPMSWQLRPAPEERNQRCGHGSALPKVKRLFTTFSGNLSNTSSHKGKTGSQAPETTTCRFSTSAHGPTS